MLAFAACSELSLDTTNGGNKGEAAAYDSKGNLSEMNVSELCDWTSNDFRPISEFVEKWEANKASMKVMSLSAVR